MDAARGGDAATDVATDAEIARSALRGEQGGGPRELQRWCGSAEAGTGEQLEAEEARCPAGSAAKVPSSNGATKPARVANQPKKEPATQVSGSISAAEADRLAAEVEAARTQRLAERPTDAPGDGEPGSELDALDE